MLSADERLFARLRKQSFPLRLLARGLLGSANRFRLLAHLALGRLLEGAAKLHLAKHAFALQLLLQDPHGLFDIVFTDEDLQRDLLFEVVRYGGEPSAREMRSFVGRSDAALGAQGEVQCRLRAASAYGRIGSAEASADVRDIGKAVPVQWDEVHEAFE